MNIIKISKVFFSPTESTKKVLTVLTDKLPIAATEIDLTTFAAREQKQNFAQTELVVFGVPVYGGRVPAPAMESLARMQGQKTPAVLVVVYGNRDFDDALLEMKDLVEQQGFVVVGAAAFIAEHSIMHSVAKGRPDEEDMGLIFQFAQAVWSKIQKADGVEDFGKVEVTGKRPYKEYGGVPFKPKATKDCTKCGTCAENCPVQAIPRDCPSVTKEDFCISCMRCLKVCPAHARKLNGLKLAVVEKAFAAKCSARQEPELFL